MPLTLDCFGCGDAMGITVCQLAGMYLYIWDGFKNEGIDAAHSVFLRCPGKPDLSVSDGSAMYDLSSDMTHYVDNWGALELWGYMDASVRQPPEEGAAGIHSGGGFILLVYECTNTSTGATTRREVVSEPWVLSVNDCYTHDPDFHRSHCSGVGGTIWTSSPLGACNGCMASETVFLPYPEETTIDLEGSIIDNLCLCASGGSGNYSYSLAQGTLPFGLGIDPSSGCMSGTILPGMDVAGGSLTFHVEDNETGESAEVECGGFHAGCTKTVQDFGNEFY